MHAPFIGVRGRCRVHGYLALEAAQPLFSVASLPTLFLPLSIFFFFFFRFILFFILVFFIYQPPSDGNKMAPGRQAARPDRQLLWRQR